MGSKGIENWFQHGIKRPKWAGIKTVAEMWNGK
jgi:hypothetical protein